jgi:hypothetical protein
MYHIDGSETLHNTIQWYKDILQVITGMSIKDAEQMIPLIEQRCEGSAQAAFQDTLTNVSFKLLNIVDQQVEQEQGKQKVDDTTAEDYKVCLTEARARLEKTIGKITKKDIIKCLQKVIEAASPYKVLQKQKKYMRCYMRKPRDMTIRQFVNAVTRMNNNELPHLPPFEANQKLPEDDIVEIVLHACPNSWIQEMDRQDFDADHHTLQELLQFLERIESLEPTMISHTNNASSASEHKSNTKKPTGKVKTGMWCDYHHKTDSHNTSECRSLEYHKKKEGQKGNNNNWKKKADENKTYTRKELNAILNKVMKKEKDSGSKEKSKPERKRKAEKAELSMMDEAESQSVRSELEETNSFITSTTTSTDRGEKNNIDELLDDLSIESNDS